MSEHTFQYLFGHYGAPATWNRMRKGGGGQQQAQLIHGDAKGEVI